jgi:anion-transporting  ArsA/GET3 family ATPase
MVKSIEKLNKKVGTKKTVKKQTVKKEKPTEVIKAVEVEKKIDTVDPMMAMMQSMNEMINQLKEQNELLKNQNNNQVVIKDDDQPKEKQIKDEIIYEIV